LSKWKILKKTKKNTSPQKQEIDISINDKKENTSEQHFQKTQENHEKQESTGETTNPQLTPEKKEYTPVKTYKETLYSTDHPLQKKNQIHQRQRWENAETIGKNVDSIDTDKKNIFSHSNQKNRIEEKIDCLLSRQKPQKQNHETEKTSDDTEGYIAKKNKKTGLTYYAKK
jgi:hypothetical protein